MKAICTIPVTLEHQDMLTKQFVAISPKLAEYTFANIYLFRSKHKYCLVNFEGETFIQGQTLEGQEFIMPTSAPNKELWKHLIAQGQAIYPLEQRWIESFLSEKYQCHYFDSQSDYVYDTKKIAFLPGRNLSGKRNLIHQFQGNYAVHFEELCSDNITRALTVIEKWADDHKKNVSSSPAEQLSPLNSLEEHTFLNQSQKISDDELEAKEAVKLFEILKLRGLIIYADEIPVALAIGEALNEDTFVVHFAKALRSYKGSYQYMFELFAQQVLALWQPKSRWINFEQDLGNPFLAKAKRSYLPEYMAKKWLLSQDGE